MNLARIKALPWKIIGLSIVALIAIAAIIFGVNRALENAKQSGRDEIQAKWDAEKRGAAEENVKLTTALSAAFNGLDGTLQNTIRTLHVSGQTITVRVKKELDNDPRYSDPGCSLTDGVRSEVNAARDLSNPAAPAPVRSGSVSSSGAAVRFEFGDAGSR